MHRGSMTPDIAWSHLGKINNRQLGWWPINVKSIRRFPLDPDDRTG
jgi:hypothetical protein